MNAWLYPVSGNGDHRFADRRGKKRPVTFEEIRDAVLDGAFPSPAEWTCVQNGANVTSGDELFLYTGRGDVGIFAAGNVVDAKPSKKTTEGGTALWTLTWKLDVARTKRLLEKPVAAAEVREHVHPRVTVRDFTAGAKALKRRLR
ncbi:MAG: hypothetical protein LC750_17855 [Actinobacteria bacterium]|nr:hypothetical protein [Actinomycetota bacterium]